MAFPSIALIHSHLRFYPRLPGGNTVNGGKIVKRLIIISVLSSTYLAADVCMLLV